MKSSRKGCQVSRRIETPFILLALGASILAACEGAPAPAPETAAPVRVESPALGIAIADLPAALRVDVNEGGRLELVPATEGATGRIEIVLGPQVVGGVNLLESIRGHQASIEERGGVYRGQLELGGPLGTAFYSRGTYPEGDGTVEETVMFLVHPWDDRDLRLVYRYPAADDSSERIQSHLMALLAEIEALDVAGPAAMSEEAAAGPDGSG